MPRNEKETREKLIDPALRKAGWHVLDEKYIIERNKACIETPVTGMPKTTENQTGNGFVDYVLFGDDCKPLALIEAKKSAVSEEMGRVQACLYADALEAKYGVRPVIYYTNGYRIMIIDGVHKTRQVFGFHKKDELEYLIQRRSFKLANVKVNEEICNREYQKQAIQEVVNNFNAGNSRSLIVLATGTGKTRVSCAISDILLRNNYVKRILFLADRVNLVKQAKEETFEKFIDGANMAVIAEGQREGISDKARIVFSTYQSMISIINDTEKCPYGIGHFDLIIVDEAHRSLFNKYSAIFQYFDAMMIGLTATPRNDIGKSTFQVFEIGDATPHFEYDVIQAVKQEYLTYYRALDRTPDILKDGLTYNDLSDEEQEQYEDLFTDEEGVVPEKIEGKEFYSIITNIDTIREVLRDLMEEGIRLNNGQLGKTIIFAKDHNHALLIQQTFREMYPELCLKTNRNGVDYCVVIDNQIKYNEVLQREFKNKQDIRIVVSVDMMDTGVDIPEVVNLVFFKKVLSKIKFWQMIGRGTRLCKNLNALTPSKEYFQRLNNDKTRSLHQDKQGFLIFDICNVFPFFKMNPDGREDRAEDALSLYQKVFMQKATLYKVMQANYSKLEIVDKKYFETLREELLADVRRMNPNYIGVKANLEYVNKYSQVSGWVNFNQTQWAEVKKHIAPNIQGEIDLEASRGFDYLCYKFASARLYNNTDFKKTAKTIYTLATLLIDFKSHIGEVAAHRETLKYVASEEFINDSTITRVDEVREEIRGLMRYIDSNDFKPIVSDFDDAISTYEDADEESVDFKISIDDFKSLDDKLLFHIQENPEIPLVSKVQNLVKPTAEDVQQFKGIALEIAKNEAEYNKLFATDDELVIFVRKNLEFNPVAVDHYLNALKEKGFNETQIIYARELLLFISQNGRFDRRDLLREELNFNGIFNSQQIRALIDYVESLI